MNRPVSARVRRARRGWRLLTTRGPLAVNGCPLCAALVLADGSTRHAEQHAADAAARDDEQGVTA